MSARHTYTLGLIGNCSYAALVDTRACVRWMCWPRFDSSFIFGGLLDEQKGGEFSISPSVDDFQSSQTYVDNTNVLVTRFEVADGVFEVIDFAPRFLMYERYHRPLMMFRKVRRISGYPRIKVKCRPVGDYGEWTPEVHLGSHHIRYSGLAEPVRLTTNASLTFVREEKDFTLNQDLYFVLSWGYPLEGPLERTVEDYLQRTIHYWQQWVERCTLPRSYQKEVIRSALALKLHQFEDTGGVIASCTTSLPEIEGEGRNWDYRFCWLRDAYYTISAFHSLGHFAEMERYSNFIENLGVHTKERLQPVYRIDGGAQMTEIEIPLAGYLGHQPVRVGNEAADQIQHDAYGQSLLAIVSLYTDARMTNRSARGSARDLDVLLRRIETTLEEPDNGIWEFRGKRSLHTYSLLFHWAGGVACQKAASELNLRELADRAAQVRARAEDLLEKCYNKEKKAYAQAVGSSELDASLLQMIPLGYFLDKPRDLAVNHLRAIQRELEVSPGFLLRYKHGDDFGVQKSAFLVCSFWLIEALVELGFLEEAEEKFNHVLKAQNHLGLLSEDCDVSDLSQWGNFPQTYSHVGLINCAFALDRALRKPFFM